MQTGSAQVFPLRLSSPTYASFTNELEKARQYSILADGIQQDRCFLLSSYESVLLAHPIRALDAEDVDVERTGRQPPVQNENLPDSISC
jgi:hypothetical protein